ncbi:DUF4349 domain-containing protein [Salinibacterium sp. dk2585]|uniref:DUF4349 domain-containing protein n=1 Tax=unclassified Salinibacterium TaxID=2632331 RepID=UPI0011C24883|nr:MULTISPECIES: DUF4349 domain-containing protein [unclassified Salinibacterium]QEE62006.1 DUF4349 domain-containing protein [Salinibacterium sp. dk2585]TXK54439.1 DUF4349 domain-containing protein [Salinibacterium sp. dk5596]
MRRRLLLPATILLTLAALTGCSADARSGFSEARSDSGGQAVGEALPDVSDERRVEQVEAQGRQVIVTGDLWLTVEDPRDAADAAADIVERAGGHVDNRSETAPRDDDPGRAELTVRIPSAKLSSTLNDLEELGEVEETRTYRQDVTSVAKDLDARITALEASVDRLLALMVDADTTSDLITIESTLAERQADLESLQSQRRSIADQVDYSTITVHLGSEADAPVDDPDTFWTGLVAGWDALVGFVSFLLVALGVILPWLIVPAIALLLTWVLLRRRRRQRGAASVVSTTPDDARD